MCSKNIIVMINFDIRKSCTLVLFLLLAGGVAGASAQQLDGSGVPPQQLYDCINGGFDQALTTYRDFAYQKPARCAATALTTPRTCLFACGIRMLASCHPAQVSDGSSLHNALHDVDQRDAAIVYSSDCYLVPFSPLFVDNYYLPLMLLCNCV